MSPEAVRQTLHELGVHQIELELQNEELRRMQVTLDAAGARYFDLYDLAPVGYVTVSESGLILQTNFAACTLVGVARGALVGQPFSRFIHKADQDIWYLHRKQLFATGALQTFELRLERPDGLSCWVQLAVTTALDTDGTSVGRMVLIDLTGRKQMEEALRNRDARQAKMVANIGDVIVIIDHEGINRYKSPNVEKLFGWSARELVGVSALDKVHPDDLDSAGKFVGALLGEPNATGTTECRYRCKDGRHCWIEFTGINLLHDPDIRGLLGNYRDITERKQSYEALRNRDARHAKMVANIGDVIVIIDRDGRTRYRSPSVEKLFGWSPEGSMGRGALENVHPDDLAFAQRRMAEILGEPYSQGTLECRYQSKDGCYQWIEFTGTNLLHDPDIQGILGNFRNITERKQIETLNQQLQKTESLGQMAGGIAHHFNNKLQTVIVSLELAKASPTQNPALVESLLKATQATREAAEVSALMLTYLGQSQVKYESLDISDVCLAGLPLLRAAMPANADLETDLPSPGPVISANANQIQQVLTSLMTNAWEAKGEGPNHLRLGIKTVTAADIPVTRRFPLDFQIQETAYACLEVVDAGSGITAKDMGKLFDPFFSSKFAGRGLGLPVVLGIVRSHQGVVTVESEPGRGSIFRVFFPVVAEAVRPKRQAPVEPISENLRPGTTVLVVEDDENLRDTLALMLEFSDYTVLTAEDGVAALEIFRQHRDEIGCVLCDVTMPRKNGWETLTALRQLAPGLPVILLSGHSDDQIMAGDHPEQPQAFFRKPCDVQVLLNALNQCLAKKKELAV